MSIWKNTEIKHEKPWGFETRWGSPFGMGGKLIHIHKGHRTSLKYYKMKNQLLYCLHGNVKIHAPDEREFGIRCCEGKGNYFSLEPGDYILIQSENPYRVEALVDAVMVEVVSGMDGPVTVLADDYGRKVNVNLDCNN